MKCRPRTFIVENQPSFAGNVSRYWRVSVDWPKESFMDSLEGIETFLTYCTRGDLCDSHELVWPPDRILVLSLVQRWRIVERWRSFVPDEKASVCLHRETPRVVDWFLSNESFRSMSTRCHRWKAILCSAMAEWSPHCWTSRRELVWPVAKELSRHSVEFLSVMPRASWIDHQGRSVEEKLRCRGDCSTRNRDANERDPRRWGVHPEEAEVYWPETPGKRMSRLSQWKLFLVYSMMRFHTLEECPTKTIDSFDNDRGTDLHIGLNTEIS